jgi:uncharacterized protein YkwD
MKRALISAVIVLLASPLAHSEMEATRTTLREHVLKLINRDRKLYNLPPVELDLNVSVLGDRYCQEQIRTNSSGHYGVDGLSPYMRYSFAGGNDGVSENAAAWSASYAFSEKALYEMAGRSQDAMMAEMPPKDGHKKTILDPHATHVGIGLAWNGGEFRLVHEFVRRYVAWTRALPRDARTTDTPILAGRPLENATIEAISVHYERMPETMPASVASAIDSYSLPSKRRDYFPRLKQEYKRYPDGTLEIRRREYTNGHRGDFYLGKSGEFSFPIPFTEGPGLYTVVVWVKRPGFSTPVPASNVSVRVEEALQTPPRASAAGR